MKTYTITHIGDGWYDYSDLPQTAYIKIGMLLSGDETRAKKTAVKILKNNNIKAKTSDILIKTAD